MKRLVLLSLLAMGLPADAAAGHQLAPPVVRKPSAATSAPAIPSSASPDAAAPMRSCGGAGAAPCGARLSSAGGEDAYFNALAASAESGSDPILDKGLMRAMSRLMAANRCNDAVALATQNRRAELAGRAKQLCKAN